MIGGPPAPRSSTTIATADPDLIGSQLRRLHPVAGNRDLQWPLRASRLLHAEEAYHPVPARLFRNEGGGRFKDVTVVSGITKADDAGLGVVTARLQRRRLARRLRRQRRRSQQALDQPARRHVRGRRGCRVRLTARTGGRGGHGRDRGRRRPATAMMFFVAHLAREANELFANEGRGGFRTSLRGGAAPPTADYTGFGPTGSTTTTMAGSTSSAPTVRSR